MANGHGGKREGAGKPVASATLYAQEFRQALAARIKANADEWMSAIEALAVGHWKEGKNGRVFKTSPDANAWKIAIDRSHGLLRQETDITSGGDKLAVMDAKTAALVAKFEAELKEKTLE